jgi:hypothetical protein
MNKEGILILVLYVDDLFLIGAETMITKCKQNLAKEFEMKDLALMHYFLGLEIWQQKGEIFLGQGKYTVEILKRFGMEDCKPMATPMVTNLKKLSTSESQKVNPTIYRQLIGCLMYLTNTRLDICFAVNTLSQHMVDPRRVHWIATKHILRYLKDTIRYKIQYIQRDQIRLMGYSYLDWPGNNVDRKSTSGGCFSIGSGMISWYDKKQKSVALSSTKVEYMAANQASCEALWLQKILIDLFESKLDPTVIL